MPCSLASRGREVAEKAPLSSVGLKNTDGQCVVVVRRCLKADGMPLCLLVLTSLQQVWTQSLRALLALSPSCLQAGALQRRGISCQGTRRHWLHDHRSQGRHVQVMSHIRVAEMMLDARMKMRRRLLTPSAFLHDP